MSSVPSHAKRLRRRTQVAKGEVCKTSIQRFESARRLHPYSDEPQWRLGFCSDGQDSSSGNDRVVAPDRPVFGSNFYSEPLTNFSQWPREQGLPVLGR